MDSYAQLIAYMSAVVTAAIFTGGLVWGFSNSLSNKISTVYARIEKAQEVILTKLEYHERHDDQRFTNINNELWAIKVRNASKDGHLPQANVNA